MAFSEDIVDLSNTTTITIESKNLLNKNDPDFLKNKIIGTNGEEIENENNSTTGFIDCKYGEGLWCASSDTLEQDVHIEAHFPNVQNSHEIEDAFNNLVNIASQRAYKTQK